MPDYSFKPGSVFEFKPSSYEKITIPTSSPKLGRSSGSRNLGSTRKASTNSVNTRKLRNTAKKVGNTLSPLISSKQTAKVKSYTNTASKYLNLAKNIKKMSPKQLVQLGVNTREELKRQNERRSQEIQKKIKNNYQSAQNYTRKRNRNLLAAQEAAKQKRLNNTQRWKNAEKASRSAAKNNENAYYRQMRAHVAEEKKKYQNARQKRLNTYQTALKNYTANQNTFMNKVESGAYVF